MKPVKYSFKYIVIILLYQFLPDIAYSYAQDTWSLERCIGHALLNNLQIKEQKLSIEEAQNSVLQAKLSFIPSVDLSVNYNSQIQNTSAEFSASMPLLRGFSKTNILKSNKVQLQIMQSAAKKLENDITISITQAFLQILLSKEIYKCAQESYNSVSMQVVRTRKLVEAGSQAYSTLLDIQAQLANERVQFITASNDVKNSTLALSQLLDLSKNQDFTIEIPKNIGPLPDTLDGNMEALYSCALSLPQIRSAELELEKSRYDYKIQKGAFYPSVSLSFSKLDGNGRATVGLNMSISIFNGWHAGCAAKNALLNIRKNELYLEKQPQQLYNEIVQAYTDASDAYEKYLAAQQNMNANRESFNHVVQKFNIGMLESTDYIVAKTNLSRAESEYYRAKFQYLFQLKLLDFYKGIPITL